MHWFLVVPLLAYLHLVSGGDPPADDFDYNALFRGPDQSRSLDGEFVIDGSDMMLTKEQYQRLHTGVRGRNQGKLAAEPWTNGVIPYEITNQFDSEKKAWILRAMRNWEKVTCVRFRPRRSSDRNYITIKHGSGCWAHLGMLGNGRQEVNLDINGCFWKGTIEHELGHALGMIHEHQRPNRNAYLRVNYYGVDENKVDSVTKYADGSDDKLGLAYDYTSVMHYPKTAFAKDYFTQILFPRDVTQTDVIGMILGPSFLDAKLINMMYNCSARCQRPRRCRNDCVLTENCECFCPENMEREVCRDKHQECPNWARTGECHLNSGYMHDKCRLSCGICKPDGTNPHVPCVDRYNDCDQRKRNGQCDHPSYMLDNLKYCPRTCGLCSDSYSNGACRDTKRDCQTRASNGECDRNPRVMLTECKRSCEFCVEQIGQRPSRGSCGNFDSVCTFWADTNVCNRYYTWMSVNCPKACNQCNFKLPAGCVNKHPSCQDWALRGECNNNPGYMHYNCALSCDRCRGI
ncbi:zinc metalloproteinase nas-8-like [Babylonia areolata]|uniref:zinc metalloproteinase nas-8-like n=1 Tax=Babylonia areolata TaxID=304850 RepID=UPI003FD6431D